MSRKSVRNHVVFRSCGEDGDRLQWYVHLSDRGVPLLYMGDPSQLDRPLVTVENTDQWNCFYVLGKDHSRPMRVECEQIQQLDRNNPKTAYILERLGQVDWMLGGAPSPSIFELWCDEQGYDVDEMAYNAIRNRYFEGQVERLALDVMDVESGPETGEMAVIMRCTSPFATINTSHVGLELYEYLESRCVASELLVFKPNSDEGCGLFIQVLQEEEDDVNIHSQLWPIFKWARKHDLAFVRLEEEGEVIESLPIFEWSPDGDG